jgi:hypothetical protein
MNNDPFDHIATGHMDRNGQMLHAGDMLEVTVRPHYIGTDYDKEPTQRAQILWTSSGWTLRFIRTGGIEPLNNYHANELLKHLEQ